MRYVSLINYSLSSIFMFGVANFDNVDKDCDIALE